MMRGTQRDAPEWCIRMAQNIKTFKRIETGTMGTMEDEVQFESEYGVISDGTVGDDVPSSLEECSRRVCPDDVQHIFTRGTFIMAVLARESIYSSLTKSSVTPLSVAMRLRSR